METPQIPLAEIADQQRACRHLAAQGHDEAAIAKRLKLSKRVVRAALLSQFSDSPAVEVAPSVPAKLEQRGEVKSSVGGRGFSISEEEHLANIKLLVDSNSSRRHLLGELIDRKDAVKASKFSAAQKVEILSRNYNNIFGGIPIEEAISILFPEIVAKLDRTDIPVEAPALWERDKESGDTPPKFIERHYTPWLGNGLTRPDIKRLDPQLYTALANWLRNNAMPAGIDLPTLKEKNDRLVRDVEAGKRPVFGEMTARELGRLNGAIHRRKGRAD